MQRRRLSTLAAIAGTTVLAAAAGVATNVATESQLPPALRNPVVLWTIVGGLTIATAMASWWIESRRNEDLAAGIPAQQRPEPWVVERPAEVEKIVRALRARLGRVTVVVHGAGGSGKTTIAQLASADPRVLRRFGGRVYWVTLGQEIGGGTLADKVNDLTRMIAPDRAYPYTDLRHASENLAAILAAGPRRLLILDDVWFDYQLAAFPAVEFSARLVTTRVASLVASDSTAVRIDWLQHDQARQLLTADLPPLPDALADQLIRLGGGWPLLLRLINKTLLDATQSGGDIVTLADELAGRLRRDGPAQFESQWNRRDANARSRSVAATIEASTGLLQPGDRDRFAELAIFAEDDDIAIPEIAVLWRATGGLGELETRVLCARLSDLALLARKGVLFRLHDVLRSYLRDSLGAERLRGLNRIFIDEVVADGGDAAWWEISASVPYFRSHLVGHLMEAGREAEAEALATDMRWVQLRLEHDGPLGPDADLALVGTDQAARLRRSLAEVRLRLTEAGSTEQPAPLTAFVERTIMGRATQPMLLGTGASLDGLLDWARLTHDPERWEAEAAAQFRAGARVNSAFQALRHRFAALIALALAKRGLSTESTRDLCLAALREIDVRGPRDSEVRVAVLIYLGLPAQGGEPGLVGSALRALVGRSNAAGFEEIVPLLATSETAARLILDTIRNDGELAAQSRAFLGTRPDASEDWAPVIERWRRDRRRLIYQLSVVDRLGSDPESLRKAEDLLSDYQANAMTTGTLDDLTDAIAVLRTALSAGRFDEKDAALRKAERLAGAARAEVRAAPTALGVELADPAAERVEELARKERRELVASHPPKPEIAEALPSARLRDGVATLQIRIGNADDRAPLESVLVDITGDPARFVIPQSRIKLPAVLHGGTSETILVRLDTRDDPDTVEVGVALTHGNAAEVLSERLSVPVDRGFERIRPNPFTVGALGRPIADPQMFYGRDDLISRIRQRLREATSPGAGIAIFGQKRTGKSSIRLQLRRRLAEDDGLPVVDVGNLGELTPQQSTGTLLGVLLWRILEGADSTITEGPRLIPDGFDRRLLITSPDPVLDFSRILLDRPHHPPWVVMMDEFQYLEQWIRARLIPASVLQAFKAIIERQLFHLVLVGQSELERLITDDANTFGVFGLERVTYLAEPDARALIQRPIRTADGETRYRGRAVDEILRLTGGSPYYIQRICGRLVDYMNDERASLVTEADVALVSGSLLDTLTAGDFDSLQPATDPADARRLLAAVDAGEERIAVGLYEQWLRRNFRRGPHAP